MPNSPDSKSITLTPHWKAYFGWYLLAILTIPLFGLGLILLYVIRRKQTARAYKITDTQITSIDARYQRNIDLANIEEINLRQSWLNQKLDVGTLILETSSVTMELTGLEHPQRIEAIMKQAVAAEKDRLRQKGKEKEKPKEPQHKPGTMDKMDYLTGLWQQGLISDEDFEAERKHFE